MKLKNDYKDIHINPLKTKSTFNPRNKNAAIEFCLSSLEEKLLILEIPKDKFYSFTECLI